MLKRGQRVADSGARGLRWKTRSENDAARQRRRRREPNATGGPRRRRRSATSGWAASRAQAWVQAEYIIEPPYSGLLVHTPSLTVDTPSLLSVVQVESSYDTKIMPYRHVPLITLPAVAIRSEGALSLEHNYGIVASIRAESRPVRRAGRVI